MKNFLVGDETGLARLVLWDEQIEDFNFNEGDVIEIIRAYTKEAYNGGIELRLGNYGIIRKVEKEVDVKDKDGSSIIIKEYEPVNIISISKDNHNVSFNGYMVHILKRDPILYLCSKCGKRLNSNNVCDVHGNVEPQRLIILSVIVDDGTSSIISNFFRRDAELLVNKSLDEIEDILKNEGIDSFYSDIEKKVLRRYYKIKGSVKRNSYNDTLEVTVHNFKSLKKVI